MDTSQVTDMSQMFMNCRSLKNLDLTSFKTGQVQNMSQMFGGCSDLRTLNVANFDTSQVTNMNGMFAGCETLEELDLSKFDTTKVKNMTNMFESTDALKSLKLGKKFVVSKEQAPDLKLIDRTWIDIGTGTIENPKPTNKAGISSNELLAQSDKGNWVVKPDQEYHGPMTVQITNNLSDDLIMQVPLAIQPEFVGSTFEINVPQKVGYTNDKKTIKVMALENKLSSTDNVTYTKIEQPAAPVEKVVAPVKKSVAEKPAVKKPVPEVSNETESPDSFAIKGTVTKFMKYVTIHPDLKIARVYDATGTALPDKALIKNYSWFSDKILTIGARKYYHVGGNEWVSSEDAYVYEETKNLVQTKNVMITPIVDSRGQAIVNRGLAASYKVESDKVITINDHKFYQVTTDEFVDSDKVDLVKA